MPLLFTLLVSVLLTYVFANNFVLANTGDSQTTAVVSAWDPITFDSNELTYTLTGFGGAEDSTVVVDPTDPINNVARVVKSATAELWAGTTVSTGPNQSVPTLPFTASDTTMTVRVWSPDAGIQVRLKVEDAADGTKSVETEATTTVANNWETLTFDFANQAAGTAALNLAYTYNKASIFFNFGVTGSVAGEKTYYFDDMTFGDSATPPPPPGSGISAIVDDFESGLPSGKDAYDNGIGFVTWGDTWSGTTVAIKTTLVGDGDPLALPDQSGDNNLLQFTAMVNGWGFITHAFENEEVDAWVTQDWSSYEGIAFWLYGQNTGNNLLFEIQDNRNPGSTVADTEIWSHGFVDNFSGWRLFVLDFDDDFVRKEIGNGAPNDGFGRDEVHGWAFGSLNTGGATVTYYLDNVMVYGNTGSDQPLFVAFTSGQASVAEGGTAVLTVALSRMHDEAVTVEYTTAESNGRPYQYTPVNGTLTFPAGTLTQTISIDTYHDGKYTRDVRVAVNLYEGSAPLGVQRRAVLTIVDIDPADPRLVDDFQAAHPFIYQSGDVELSITTLTDDSPAAVPGQWDYEEVLTFEFDGEASFGRVFSQGQDWSGYDGVSFWFYGQNSGDTFTYQLRENMAATTADVAPEDWVLVWSDEFNGPAGERPNPNVWKFELGDGALNNSVGWGNSEFQYYTDSADNSFMDGNGNLVIRLQDTAPDTDLVCWYGPCEHTSARLLTQDRLDFEYGRIEARVQVPGGPSGLWPAFWMLGTDIPEVGWPQSGEIDIMEYVSRLPNEVFGTIHGPGYQGGTSFGNTLTFTDTVPNQGFLTYGVIWMPDHIIWYVDDVEYHQAIPANVAPNEWVFNHPFFMLLNAAIGGNFGGAISDAMTFPQDTLVDYVRVYQAADTAERFEASFVDDFAGWQKINLPFAGFIRSADQPAGAPDDGLTLTEVWGYDLLLPADGGVLYQMDRVYLEMYDQFTIGGTVSGLTGTGLVLQNNGGDDLAIAADGAFTFGTALDDLSAYAVTVFTQPDSPSQTCVVSNGDGNLSGADVTNVEVTCTINQFTIGGTVSGLTGTGLVLQNNGGDDLAIAAEGAFIFGTALDDLSAYEVTVFTQPTAPTQTCTVSNGSNSLTGANVTDITVNCLNEPPEVSLSTNMLDFGVIFEGNSTTASVTLINTGTGELVISEMLGPNLPFSITGGSCTALHVTMLPGESCDIEIAFTPPEAFGDFVDELNIISNADSSPDTLTLAGSVRPQPLPVPSLDRYGLLLLMLLFMGLAWRRSKADERHG